MVNIVSDIANRVKINRVLLSVSDKAGLEMLVPGLLEINPGVHFYSTGGTSRAFWAMPRARISRRWPSTPDSRRRRAGW